MKHQNNLGHHLKLRAFPTHRCNTLLHKNTRVDLLISIAVGNLQLTVIQLTQLEITEMECL